MRHQGHLRTWLIAAVSAVALSLAPGPATAAADPPYLNLHQCLYWGRVQTEDLTTVVPSLDGRFATGTNISNTADSRVTCGGGDGNYIHSVALDLVTNLALNAGRYLNLHQCAYYSTYWEDHETTVVPNPGGQAGAGTNISDTADTTPSCGPGTQIGSYEVIPLLSSAKALDLHAGRYLNLHQCVYYSSSLKDHFTTVVTSRDGRFAAGTNISDTADTTPSCGPGDGNFVPVPILSGVKALPLP
ncbi:hypothetical protein [Streptomyces sp. NPDC101165]|uniref:hypothetical protein n=1 Tax=Streptomyces sp. NPDC101165 TaxID=3366119 RepID=UPI003822101F